MEVPENICQSLSASPPSTQTINIQTESSDGMSLQINEKLSFWSHIDDRAPLTPEVLEYIFANREQMLNRGEISEGDLKRIEIAYDLEPRIRKGASSLEVQHQFE